MTSIKNDFLFRCKSETSEVVLVTAESQILELNINSLLSSRVFILQILPWWPTHHFSLSLGSHRSGRGSWNLQVVDCRHQLLFLPLSQELSAQAKYPGATAGDPVSGVTSLCGRGSISGFIPRQSLIYQHDANKSNAMYDIMMFKCRHTSMQKWQGLSTAFNRPLSLLGSTRRSLLWGITFCLKKF